MVQSIGMHIFAATYTDSVKFNRKPNEDYFWFQKPPPIFALADGVTRYVFEDSSYAYPAGAKATAEIFCRSVVEYLEKELDIPKAFNFANARIQKLNESEGMIKESLNYQDRDFFDCVGVAAFVLDSTLTYGYLSDCGLAVYSKTNALTFQTENALQNLIRPYTQKDPKQRRILIRKELRNNPNGNGYGTFTGEQSAQIYYKTGALELAPFDLVVLYSDGFVEYLQFSEVLHILRKGDRSAMDAFVAQKAKENPEMFGHDRTFIAFSTTH